jgi:hypothetical protein
MSKFQEFITDSIKYTANLRKREQFAEYGTINDHPLSDNPIPKEITDLSNEAIFWLIEDYTFYLNDRDSYVNELKEVWNV